MVAERASIEVEHWQLVEGRRYESDACDAARAHQLKHDDYDAFVARTKKAHHALPKLLINLFRDVLVLRGVPIEFRPGRRLAEPAADDHG